MCEDCAATEDTFREVGADGLWHWQGDLGLHYGDIVYVLRAGRCMAGVGSYEWSREHRAVLLGRTGLIEAPASWVLAATTPIPDTRAQNV